jgi:hypothetical protein
MSSPTKRHETVISRRALWFFRRQQGPTQLLSSQMNDGNRDRNRRVGHDRCGHRRRRYIEARILMTQLEWMGNSRPSFLRTVADQVANEACPR